MHSIRRLSQACGQRLQRHAPRRHADTPIPSSMVSLRSYECNAMSSVPVRSFSPDRIQSEHREAAVSPRIYSNIVPRSRPLFVASVLSASDRDPTRRRRREEEAQQAGCNGPSQPCRVEPARSGRELMVRR
jgi:hypothetical protein